MFCQFVLMLSILAEPNANPPVPKKYALFIAVTTYQHALMNKPELRYPEADAVRMAELFRQAGYQVDVLLGADANLKSIRSKLASLKNKGLSDGIVVVGLFGHGIEYVDRREAYFCPYDSKLIDRVNPETNRLAVRSIETDMDPSSLVSMPEILSALRLSACGQRLLLSDCCRTEPNRGRQPKGRAFGASLRVADLPDNTAAFFACSSEEQAFEHASWGHGAFTKAFLETVTRLVRSNQSVTLGRIADEVTPEVKSMVSRVTDNIATQTPRILLNGRVDLLFKPAVGVVAVPASEPMVQSRLLTETDRWIGSLRNGNSRASVELSITARAGAVVHGQVKFTYDTGYQKDRPVVVGFDNGVLAENSLTFTTNRTIKGTGKIPVEYRLTLEDGKLVGSWHNLDDQSRGNVTLAPAKEAKPIVLNKTLITEDFSDLPLGELPPGWVSKSLTIQKVDGQPVLIRNEIGKGTVTLPEVNVPSDFVLDCDFATKGYVNRDRSLAVTLEWSGSAPTTFEILDRYPNRIVSLDNRIVDNKGSYQQSRSLQIKREGKGVEFRINGESIHIRPALAGALVKIKFDLTIARDENGRVDSDSFPLIKNVKLNALVSE